MIDVLLAAPEVPQEPELVAAAPGAGLTVVRRCVDTVDLLAAAALDAGACVVVSAALPRLTPEAVDRLRTPAGRPVIGLAPDEAATGRLLALGVIDTVRVGPTATATLQHLAGLLADSRDAGAASGVWSTGCWTAEPSDPPADEPREGTIVAVWGPMGSPGRTTVAIGVAEAVADAGRTACVVDADTYAPSIAMLLGLLDEGGGLAGACRLADSGALTPTALLGATRRVRGGLHALPGLSAARHWSELRGTALERVWAACRAAFDVTVIDIGFCVEDDDGAWSRRRNATALTALANADRVVAVADSSPVGAARVAQGWRDLPGPLPPTALVRNRSRGRDHGWEAAVNAAGIDAPVFAVPTDARALADCWGHARTLAEGARRSRIRRALVDVADAVVSG